MTSQGQRAYSRGLQEMPALRQVGPQDGMGQTWRGVFCKPMGSGPSGAGMVSGTREHRQVGTERGSLEVPGDWRAISEKSVATRWSLAKEPQELRK